MNIRQQKYKKNRLLGMNCYNAARAAGYAEATAKVHTKELEARVKIADVLERQGLTDKILVGKLSELLNATKVIGYLHSYKKNIEKGRAESVSPDEVISNEFLDTPDWSARAKGLELALKLKDLLKERVEHTGSTTPTIIVIRPEGKEKVDAGITSKPEAATRQVFI